MTLGAREEFKIYLLMYAKRLGAEGLKGKIEELLRSLMGNIFEDEDDDKDGGKVLGEGEANGSSQGSTNKEELVGWKREELLKEVVVVLGKHRDLQRITVPYARLLGVVEQQRPANEDGEMDTEL
ncbi:putative histone transcription regulator protein [Neofusicoccum parvum UCRNP2]|nr:putative histone transcription regulator protein [Neofusicoccum parvum UCRNP2]